MRRLAVPLFLILASAVYAARPVLSTSPVVSVKPRELTIQGSSPGMRLQFFDGVRPIGAVVVDRSGNARLAIGSLPSGQHVVRAVEWGTGKSVTDSLRFTIPAQPVKGLAPGGASTTGIQAVVMATGDLDGDGFASVILADADGVSVVRNKSGVFESPVKMATLLEATAIVVQDFNGDGLNDLAVASVDGRVAILLNRGGGEFAPALYAEAGAGPTTMVSADFNGDGIPDLAIANQDSNDISMLLGNGDGSFRTAASIPTGNSPRALVAADFNGDGLSDLATANFASNNVSILLGNGKGGFRNGGVFSTGKGPASLVTADFDEDGVADLAVLNQLDGNVLVMLNDGSGAFPSGFMTPAIPRTIRNKPFRVSIPDASSLAVGDIDGDGHADLVIRSGATLLVRNGRGNGNFGDGYSTPAGESEVLIGVDDFDRDGRMDAVMVDRDGKLSVVAGSGTLEPDRVSLDAATSFTVTFVGLRDGEPVLSYYNAGFGGFGTGPGPNDGAIFVSALACTSASDCSNVANFPSGSAGMLVGTGASAAIMNVPGGFTTSFSFYYTAPGYPGSVTVYSGQNQTGATLASMTLPINGSYCNGASQTYSCWSSVNVPFSGTAQSVAFGGQSEFIVFDNISIGNSLKLLITTSFLPTASVGVQYTQSLSATNGFTPYTWSLIGAPPPGMTLTPSGTLTGTPTAAGNYSLNVSVTDRSNPIQTATGTIFFQVFQPTCTYNLSSSSTSLTSGSGSGSFFAYLSGAGCTITATADATSPWVQNVSVITGGTTATVNYSVLSNNAAGSFARTGQIDLIESTPGVNTTTRGIFNITQAGTSCDYGLSQSSQTFLTAGTGTFTVLTQAGCPWSVSSNVPWLTVQPGSGTGTGTVTFNVVGSSTATRFGLMAVTAGSVCKQTFVVTEAGTVGASINCAATVPVPTSVALEGRTELLGSLVLTCTGLTGNLTTDVILTLNTNVTNMVTGLTTDATLTNGNSTTFGQLLSNTSLHWPAVTLIPSGGTATVTIANVRGDASLLGPSQTPVPITAQVSLNSSVPAQIATANPPMMATASTTLSFQVLSQTSPENGGVTSTAPGTVEQVIYQEAIPTAFHAASGNTPATTFRLVLSNVPAGVNVFAPVFPNGGSSQAQFYTADCSGNGGSPVSSGQPNVYYKGTTLYYQLQPVGGVATATWGMLSATSAIDTVTLPLLVEGTNYATAWSQIQVVGSYGPVSPAGSYCSGDPSATVIPRYRDDSVPLVFSNFRVTPNISLISNPSGAPGTVALNYSATVVNEGSPGFSGNIKVDEHGAQTFTRLSPETSGTASGNISCYPVTGGTIVGNSGSSGGINCTAPGAQSTTTCPGTPAALSPPYPTSVTLICGVTSNGQLVNGGGTYTAIAVPDINVQVVQPPSVISGTYTFTGIAIDPQLAMGTVLMSVLDSNNNPVTLPSNAATIGVSNTGQIPLITTDCNAYAGWFGCPSIGFTFPLNTALLSNGTYTIQAIATNTDTPPSSVSSAPQRFTIGSGDATPPSLTISSPANGATVTTATITVSGTASDSGLGNSGISSVTVNGVAANGGTASGSNTANWSLTITLNTGSNTIQVIATDGVGNQTTQTITVTLSSSGGGTPGCVGMFFTSTALDCSAMSQSVFQGNPAVSIGATTYYGAMTLVGNVPGGDAAGMALYNAGGGGGASVSLDLYNTSSNNGIPQAKIKAVDDGNYSDHLTFWTKAPGGPGNAVSEKVRITSTGSVGIGTTTPTKGPLQVASGAYVSAGGVWTNASDRNVKENFAPVIPSVILQKIDELPVTEWNYINEDPSVRHIGPVAQDFYSIFGVGNSSTSISTIDPSGIALAGIQGLDQKSQGRADQIAELKKELEAKTEELRALQERLTHLESLLETTTSGADKR